MNKKVFFVVLAVILVFIASGLLFRHNSKKQSILKEKLWEEQLVSSTEVPEINVVGQYTLERLVRGTIINYDINKEILLVTEGRFNEFGKKTEFHVKKESTIFCWPTHSNNISIAESYIALKPNETIYMKNEIPVLIGDIYNKISGQYVFIQIDDQKELIKLAILGCNE